MPSSIQITIHYQEAAHVIRVAFNEYRSLMQLITDRVYVDGFGECKGVGRCGTCLINVLNRHYTAADYERNEQTTLAKAGVTTATIRLSCQLLINKAIDGIVFEIIES